MNGLTGERSCSVVLGGGDDCEHSGSVVHCVEFSQDGCHMVVCRGNKALVYNTQVIRHTLPDTPYQTHLTRHTLPDTPYQTHLTRHTLPDTPYQTHLTRLTLPDLLHYSGGGRNDNDDINHNVELVLCCGE